MKLPAKSPNKPSCDPPTISQVLAQEFAQVAVSRNLRLGLDERRAAPDKNAIGLAFSGGGIRSATFNLGILQALAKSELLHKFDYLSTVSGGGYIGGWLMAWMKHQEIGIKEIEERLSAPPKSPQQGADQPEVHFLRDYSNYLTPRKGLLGADFLAFLASDLRNTMLNQLILVLALRTIVYFLHALEVIEECLQTSGSAWVREYFTAQNIALALGILLAAGAVGCIGLNLITVEPEKKKPADAGTAAAKPKAVTSSPA